MWSNEDRGVEDRVCDPMKIEGWRVGCVVQ